MIYHKMVEEFGDCSNKRKREQLLINLMKEYKSRLALHRKKKIRAKGFPSVVLSHYITAISQEGCSFYSIFFDLLRQQNTTLADFRAKNWNTSS